MKIAKPIDFFLVILLLALIAPIVIPTFVKSRSHISQPACVNVLRVIQAAKTEWASAHNKTTGDVVVEAQVNQYIRSVFLGGHDVPTCPAGGTYTYNPVGAPPECSFTMNNSNGSVLRHHLGE